MVIFRTRIKNCSLIESLNTHSLGLKLAFCLPSLYLIRLPLPAFALHNKLP